MASTDAGQDAAIEDAGEDAGGDAGGDDTTDAGGDNVADAGGDDGGVIAGSCWDEAPELAEVAFWVAADGDDDAAGSQAEPFATPQRASQAIRELLAAGDPPPGGLTVVLRGGEYPLTESWSLTATDSGQPDRPVTYRAFPGERVRLSGARPLEPEWLAPLAGDDPLRARLPTAARDAVRSVDLPAHGIDDFGALRRRGYRAWGAISGLELYVDGQPLELARWPNRGQTDAVDPQADAVVSGDIFGAGTDFAYLGTQATGTADDGYPNYAGTVGADTYYLYHCTWEYGGATHRYWWVSGADPRMDAQCWPSGILAWGGSGTDRIPLLDVLFSGAAEPLLARNRPEDYAQDGFVRIPEVASDTRFRLPGARWQGWSQAEDPWFSGLFGYYWADDSLAGQLGSGGFVDLSEAPSYGVRALQPMAVFNLLEELDTPGEWFLDRTGGRLLLWPEGDLTGREIRVSLLEVPLLSVAGAAHLRFEGLEFEGVRGRLIVASDARDVQFARCRFADAGGDAVRLHGRDLGLACCRVTQVGGQAVELEGGHRATLEPSGNFVSDCEIDAFGRWDRTYHVGVRPEGCGHRVEHNHIHHAPHCAILFTGNDHRIAYNEIDHVVRESNDAGAIYTGRDWGYRGTVIEFNYFHDIDSVFGGAHGVYLDDAVSGMRVHGNLFLRVHGHATMSGGGRDNLHTNNIMGHLQEGAHYTDRRARAVITDVPGDSWNLIERLQQSEESYEWGAPLDHRAEPWASAYPALAVMPDDFASVADSHWLDPEGCTFSRNVSWDTAGVTLEGSWGGEGALACYAEIADNLEVNDPLFVDEAGGDLNLRPESPAFGIPGFVPIPFDEIGPR